MELIWSVANQESSNDILDYAADITDVTDQSNTINWYAGWSIKNICVSETKVMLKSLSNLLFTTMYEITSLHKYKS